MTAFHSAYQHTLKTPVRCTGLGLHSGAPVSMLITPAQIDTGIVFKRTDVRGPVSFIPALYDRVTDTMLGTTIANEHGVAVSTIEHLMAAFWGAGVDNAYVELNAPEVPIMDGSAEPFLFLIECAGLEKQDATRTLLKVTRKVVVQEGASRTTLIPAEGFMLNISVEYPVIGKQMAEYDFSSTSFGRALARARTFGFRHEVEKMQSMGLARGGSLENAIVVGDSGVVNADGLRYGDEFVRHKALDCVGDFFLSGYRMQGEATTHRPGHGINNKMLRALMADSKSFKLIDALSTQPAAPVLPVAAEPLAAFA